MDSASYEGKGTEEGSMKGISLPACLGNSLLTIYTFHSTHSILTGNAQFPQVQA